MSAEGITAFWQQLLYKKGGILMDAIGIIYAADEGVELGEITRKRALASVPTGGRYRMIDFSLSNMVNSGIHNVGIIIQNYYNSLMVHLGSGKEWDLDRKRDGLFIFPPYSNNGKNGWYNGSADALHGIMDHLQKSKQKYVVVTKSNFICSINYNDAYRYHIEKGADITIIYKEENKLPAEELRKSFILETRNDGRVWNAEFEPLSAKPCKRSMEMYIIDKLLLEYLVEECIARGSRDFLKDVLLNKLNSIKVYGYPFNGYSANINSVLAYYRHNMDLLNPAVREELFSKSGLVYTRVMDEFPVRYTSDACVKNSLVADGCLIEGEVTNSILFRGVKVAKGAKVKNSIIMPHSDIMENSILENVILDKEVIIRNGKRLSGQDTYPMLIRKKSVI